MTSFYFLSQIIDNIPNFFPVIFFLFSGLLVRYRLVIERYNMWYKKRSEMNMIFDFQVNRIERFCGGKYQKITKTISLYKKNERNILETYSLTTLLKINKIWNEKIMRFSPLLMFWYYTWKHNEEQIKDIMEPFWSLFKKLRILDN